MEYNENKTLSYSNYNQVVVTWLAWKLGLNNRQQQMAFEDTVIYYCDNLLGVICKNHSINKIRKTQNEFFEIFEDKKKILLRFTDL